MPAFHVSRWLLSFFSFSLCALVSFGGIKNCREKDSRCRFIYSSTVRRKQAQTWCQADILLARSSSTDDVHGTSTDSIVWRRQNRQWTHTYSFDGCGKLQNSTRCGRWIDLIFWIDTERFSDVAFWVHQAYRGVWSVRLFKRETISSRLSI